LGQCREDDRAAALRTGGAEVVIGDLLEPADVYRVVSGCRRVYFGMSVSAGYLEATVTMAAVLAGWPAVHVALDDRGDPRGTANKSRRYAKRVSRSSTFETSP
jgi:hypothetical protein